MPTCPVSYFERFANLMSQEVRYAYSMSNIEIALPDAGVGHAEEFHYLTSNTHDSSLLTLNS